MAEYCTCDTDYCPTHQPAQEGIRGWLKSISRRLEKVERAVYQTPKVTSIKFHKEPALDFSSAICDICKTLKPFHTEGCDRVREELETAQDMLQKSDEGYHKLKQELKEKEQVISSQAAKIVSMGHKLEEFRGTISSLNSSLEVS